MARGTARTAASGQMRLLARVALLCVLLGLISLPLSGCDSQNGSITYPSSSTGDASPSGEATSDRATDDDSPSVAQSVRQAAMRQSSVAASQAQAAAVKQAVEAIVAPYGEAVSVTYLPVGDTAGMASVNGTTQHASASMIKLLVLAALLDKAASGEVDLAAQVEVTSDAIVSGTGTIQDDGPGTYAVQELARRMIADSDNTATNVIVDLIGMDAVNEEATKLGLTGTVMARKMMDTAAAEGGMRNRMTTDDAATILNLLACGKLVDEQMSQLAMDFLLQQTINAGLTDAIPAGVSVAHKTGELLQAEHDGGIVLAAKPYVLVVMTEGIENVTGVSIIADVSRAVYVATNGSDGIGEANTTAQGVQEAVDAAGGAEWAFGYDEPGVPFTPGNYTWEDEGAGWDEGASGEAESGSGDGSGATETPATPSQGDGSGSSDGAQGTGGSSTATDTPDNGANPDTGTDSGSDGGSGSNEGENSTPGDSGNGSTSNPGEAGTPDGGGAADTETPEPGEGGGDEVGIGE